MSVSTANLIALGVLQAISLGAEMMARRERGELTDQELSDAVEAMQNQLSLTRQRLADLIAQKRREGST